VCHGIRFVFNYVLGQGSLKHALIVLLRVAIGARRAFKFKIYFTIVNSHFLNSRSLIAARAGNKSGVRYSKLVQVNDYTYYVWPRMNCFEARTTSWL